MGSPWDIILSQSQATSGSSSPVVRPLSHSPSLGPTTPSSLEGIGGSDTDLRRVYNSVELPRLVPEAEAVRLFWFSTIPTI